MTQWELALLTRCAQMHASEVQMRTEPNTTNDTTTTTTAGGAPPPLFAPIEVNPPNLTLALALALALALTLTPIEAEDEAAFEREMQAA